MFRGFFLAGTSTGGVLGAIVFTSTVGQGSADEEAFGNGIAAIVSANGVWEEEAPVSSLNYQASICVSSAAFLASSGSIW